MSKRKVPSRTVRRGEAPEDALWRNVITQAIEDATMQISERLHGALRRQREAIRQQARDWVQQQSKDFHLVCELAGLEVNRVHKFAIDEIKKSIEKEQQRIARENVKGSMPGVVADFLDDRSDRRASDAQETAELEFSQNQDSAS